MQAFLFKQRMFVAPLTSLSAQQSGTILHAPELAGRHED